MLKLTFFLGSDVGAMELCMLTLVSKSFYVFAHTDLLWKEIVLEDYEGNFRFQGSPEIPRLILF
jgi:hypothetical protein